MAKIRPPTRGEKVYPDEKGASSLPGGVSKHAHHSQAKTEFIASIGYNCQAAKSYDQPQLC